MKASPIIIEFAQSKSFPTIQPSRDSKLLFCFCFFRNNIIEFEALGWYTDATSPLFVCILYESSAGALFTVSISITAQFLLYL